MMVQAYGTRIRQLLPNKHIRLDQSARLSKPYYRITRSSKWKTTINPWKDGDKLPLLQGGLLGELLYGGKPRLIGELNAGPDDPAYEYLEGQRSLMAIPHFDQGEVTNMVVILRSQPMASTGRVPRASLISNLFGRATYNLVLREQAQLAFDAVDRELKASLPSSVRYCPRNCPRYRGWNWQPSTRPLPVPEVIIRHFPAAGNLWASSSLMSAGMAPRSGADGCHSQPSSTVTLAPQLLQARCLNMSINDCS